MGSWLVERKRKDGAPSTWQVRYRTPDGGSRAESWPTKKAARARQREIDAAFVRRDWVDPRHGRITVAEWCDQWLATATGLRDTTRRTYRRCVDLHIVPHLGHIELGSLRPVDVQGWLAALEESELSPASVHQVWRTMRRAVSVAVRLDVVPFDVLDKVDAPPAGEGGKRALNATELATLAEVIDERYRAMVLVAGWCGLRLGELVGLRWRHVDLLRRTVTVEVQVQHPPGGGAVESAPKTKKGRRVVNLPKVVADALQVHLAAGWAEPGADGFVFPAPGGGPLRAGNWRRRSWQPAVEAAGLAGLRPHDLRHTAATLGLIAAKGNAKVVQERLGWSTIRLLDTYAHVLAGAQEQLADALDDMAAAAPRPAPRAPVSEFAPRSRPKTGVAG